MGKKAKLATAVDHGPRKSGKKGKKARAKAEAIAAGGIGPAAVASFDAAGMGRRWSGWRTGSNGPNKVLSGLQTIRNRARDTGRNEWVGRAARNRWASSMIGTGILCWPKTRDTDRRNKYIQLWDAFARECDADGVLDFYGLQRLAAVSVVEAGECFVRLRYRRLDDGLVVPLQLQVLEAEMVPIFDIDATDRANGELRAGHYIRSGIEFNRIGRRVAYWMHREHPGDGYDAGSISLHDLSRVPADQVMHIYEPDRPGQLRGVSDFAAVLPKLRSVGNFDDAVLNRQEIANLFTMIVTKEGGLPTAIDPMTGAPVQTGADGMPLAGLEPGTSQELAPGEDVKFSDPPDAGTNYGDYMRHQHQWCAAGLDLPYELLTGDVRDVSDRTLRVIMQEFRRRVEQRQWLMLIPQLCHRVRANWATACMLAGHLTPDEAAEALDVDWAPQGWEDLHPVQDIDRRIKEVRAGFSTRTQQLLKRGEDPYAIEQELADENKRADDLHLILDSDPRTIGKGVRMDSATQGDVTEAEEADDGAQNQDD